MRFRGCLERSERVDFMGRPKWPKLRNRKGIFDNQKRAGKDSCRTGRFEEPIRCAKNIMSEIFVATPEKKKPILHQIITDLIIFGPVAAVPAAIADLAMHPMHGWRAWCIFLLTALVFVITGAKMRTLGISLGFHRQGTHPSYQTYPWLRAFFFMLGSTTAQGKMVNWLSDHHHHHLHSDEDGDLHSPKDGFWHAYIGWLRGLLFDRYVYPIFVKDKMIMFFSNTFFVWLALGLVVPCLVGWATGFGAFRGLIYGGGLGILGANYVTYWVNAGCHNFWKARFQHY